MFFRSLPNSACIRPRSGATAVECAITLPVLLAVLFALLDLGIAATRYNALAEVSRRIARQVIIHGSEAPGASESWGPDEFAGTAADANDIVTVARGMTPTMLDEQVAVRVSWPVGDNSPRDPVEVEVRYLHQPLVPAFSVWGEIQLQAIATMRIVN
jgi:Flp pilus assembly protein TadG